MKKALCIILVAVMCVSLFASCAKSDVEKTTNENTDKSSGKLSIVTTIFPPYDFAKNIVGDMATVTQLLPPGGESHSFEPTSQDIVKIQNCDIFICIGGESEKWVEKLLASIDTSRLTVLSLLDMVEAKEEETVEGMQAEEEEEGGAKVEYDEHVWTSPVNAQKITKAICDAICEKDGANAKEYQYNASNYMAQLEALDKDYRDMISTAKRDRIVVADRFPFRYLCDEYSLKYSAAFAGCSASTDPSADTVRYLINKVNEDKIPVIFYIEFSQKSVLNTVLESTSAKAMELHSCHNVSQEDFDSGRGYIDIMRSNLEALREALN